MLASDIKRAAKLLNKSKATAFNGDYFVIIPGWGMIGQNGPFPPPNHPSYAIVADLLGEYHAGND